VTSGAGERVNSIPRMEGNPMVRAASSSASRRGREGRSEQSEQQWVSGDVEALAWLQHKTRKRCEEGHREKGRK
jgi:hypothetical protein